MANSKITINFASVPLEGHVLHILESNLGLNLNESFEYDRLTNYQTELPQFMPDDGIHPDRFMGYISNFYKIAFDSDYNSSSLFTVTTTNGPVNSGTGIVTIEANYPGAVFSVPFESIDATFTVNNEAPAPEFNITDVHFSEASITSDNARLNVTTNHLATKIISPVSLVGNTNNPFFFDWIRGQTFELIVEDSNGLQISQSITTPSFLNASNFSLQINKGPDSATVTAIGTDTNGLILEYSLNNFDWQTSNTFSGLDVGEYTLYVRDQFGSSFSKNFQVVELATRSPFFYISKANSIRFANRITWGDSENYKNDENTLSCEVDVNVPYKEIMQFQSGHVITTQFKSNYQTNVATIIKSDSTEVSLPVVKKTNNIGVKDKRDAIMYDLGSGQTGVYFLSGNIYDYTTGAITDTYALNGSLPIWADPGNYIDIGGSLFLIEDTFYDENKEADVIVFTNNYSGADSVVQVACIFNIFNYEVYEFTIDMADYIDQYFRVRINNTDSSFTEIVHLSEEIWCKVKHDKVLDIRYRNSGNNDMFYATGISNVIVTPYRYMKGKVDEESETNKTDTTSILLSAEMYEVDEIVFEPVTKEMWRKLTQALSHEIVSINGVGYVKNGNFNTEGPLEDSNLYVLTATMIKTGSVYNSQGSDGLAFDGTSVEIPGLIQTDLGFVSY